MKLNKFAKVALVTGSVMALALPMVVAAQTAYSIDPIGSQLGIGEADLKTTIINILQWFLGILALIAVVMVIYGGFTWLTAAGNEERVDKAKKIISAAVIGLIIVLLAWAIIIFVARTTSNVTKVA